MTEQPPNWAPPVPPTGGQQGDDLLQLVGYFTGR